MANKPRDYSRMTEREQEVLRFVVEYTNREGYPPTMREIINETSATSTSVASYLLNNIEACGYIKRTPNIARGIVVHLEGARDCL